MRKLGIIFALAVLACTLVSCATKPGPVAVRGAYPGPGNLPASTVPEGLGVNIHFTGAPAAKLDMIRRAGFRVVRMDMTWSVVERRKGVYDFGAYDALTAGLEKRGIRPLYILDYGNPLYGPPMSVVSQAGREAFARFAAAAAARYRGRGVIWELWNEPNGAFWRPRPNAGEYMKLAHVVIPAMRRADPHATIIAPATNRIDLRFLSACFRDGLLSLVNAVSVHPYRLRSPESVVADVKKLRQLMERYSPQGATIPIVSSEWGYPTIPLLFSAKSQGEYLARELLVDLSIGIRLSIWYDWHDDGTKPFNPEDNFGTVTYHYKPKPAFREMQRLVVALGGLHFVERLPSVPQDWLLLFTGPHHSEIAAWTTGSPHTVKAAGIALHLDGNPRYLSVSAGSVGQLLHNPQGGQRRKRAP